MVCLRLEVDSRDTRASVAVPAFARYAGAAPDHGDAR